MAATASRLEPLTGAALTATGGVRTVTEREVRTLYNPRPKTAEGESRRSYPHPPSVQFASARPSPHWIRNLAADPSFDEAVGKVPTFGQEAAVMGPYYPHTTYSSKAGFERRGCPRRPGLDFRDADALKELRARLRRQDKPF